MKFNLLKKLFYFSFLIAPSILALLFPISANSKFPILSIVIIFIFYMFLSGRVVFQRIFRWFFLYMALIVFFYLVTLSKMGFNLSIFQLFLNSIFLCLTPWAFVTILSRETVNYQLCVFLLALGIFTTSLIFIGYFLELGQQSSDIFSYRAKLYNNIFDAKPDVAETSSIGSMLTKIEMNSLQYFGGGPSVGPLFAMTGLFLLTYGICNRLSALTLSCLTSGAFAILACLTTGSRSAFLSLIFITVLCIIRVFSMYGKQKQGIRILAVASVLIVGIFIAINATSETNIIKVLFSIFSRLSLEEISNPQGRLLLWWNALKLFIINPLGYGFEYVRSMHEHESIFPLNLDFKHSHVHSFYFANLLEMGLLGLFVWCLLYFSILKTARNNIKSSKTRDEFSLNTALYVGISSCGFHLIFATNILRSEGVYMSVFLLFVSMIYLINTKRSKNE